MYPLDDVIAAAAAAAAAVVPFNLNTGCVQFHRKI